MLKFNKRALACDNYTPGSRSMGRTFNKIVRFFISKFSGNRLEQELNRAQSGKMCVPEIAPLCRTAAAQSAVLLKNDGVLPLKPGERVSVFGRTAFVHFTLD